MSYQPRHPSVLVVDDADDVREALALFLSHEGYAVETACDGTEALAKLRVARPCIVLLDLAMPGMTGMGFRAAQVANPDWGEVPVLICSAAPDVREVAERVGAVGYVEKPVQMSDLIALIRKHCLK